MQEMKVQNNSFSAEFGNNGGTVVNMVMKSGTDQFHGSGWYFLQRSQLDARDFFNPAPNPKPDSKRDQGGFSLGGPIIKNRTSSSWISRRFEAPVRPRSCDRTNVGRTPRRFFGRYDSRYEPTPRHL